MGELIKILSGAVWIVAAVFELFLAFTWQRNPYISGINKYFISIFVVYILFSAKIKFDSISQILAHSRMQNLLWHSHVRFSRGRNRNLLHVCVCHDGMPCLEFPLTYQVTLSIAGANMPEIQAYCDFPRSQSKSKSWQNLAFSQAHLSCLKINYDWEFESQMKVTHRQGNANIGRHETSKRGVKPCGQFPKSVWVWARKQVLILIVSQFTTVGRPQNHIRQAAVSHHLFNL